MLKKFLSESLEVTEDDKFLMYINIPRRRLSCILH